VLEEPGIVGFQAAELPQGRPVMLDLETIEAVGVAGTYAAQQLCLSPAHVRPERLAVRLWMGDRSVVQSQCDQRLVECGEVSPKLGLIDLSSSIS